MNFEGSALTLAFQSDSMTKVYEFQYFDIQKIRSCLPVMRARPSLVIQELTLLKRGVFRHALVDLLGRSLVIYCRSMRFVDLRRQ